jgi:hypothetical protein
MIRGRIRKHADKEFDRAMWRETYDTDRKQMLGDCPT